jgi:RND family efflux transporter MFP subunit
MIVVLLNVYLVFLFILVRLKIVRFNLFWKISPVIVLLLLLVGLFIPMGWGASTGPALVIRQSVPIVPNVAGEVIDVPVEPNRPIKADDILFKIDPVPYQATFDQYSAQLLRDQALLGKDQTSLARYQQLEVQNSIARQQAEDQKYVVDQDEATVKLDRALVDGAKWNLDKTVVRAPADGYVTNLALRKGARVASLPLSPVMAFVDTSETIVGVEIQQIDARYISPGQAVEVAFKFMPGRVLTGKVQAVLQAIATGQVQASGLAVTPKQIASAPFVVRVSLDDADAARRLPAGSTGEAAIYTDRVKASHVIRKVLLRQIAILNYVNPF